MPLVDLKKRKCKKNPGHKGFIPFKDLTLEHLPIEDRNTEILDIIKKMGSCVVRLVVEKIQNGKQIKVSGSGFVINVDNEYCIQTNNNVVTTEDDVKNCTVEFHYDDEDRSTVFTSRGVELYYTCPYRDIAFFTFHPVPDFIHQLDLDDKVPSIVVMYKDNQRITVKTLIIHDMSLAQLKFYSPVNLDSPMINSMFISCQDGSMSYIKSSFFKFQPIPSNRPLFTAIKILFCYRISSIKIEIHIDEDDGNSRVIPGDVVKFGDEFVVKISESIFQDEVKKCRLVWNGEVIGRGTRLYFQQVKSSDIFIGIDLEDYIKQGRENYWLFECHPIPRDIELGRENLWRFDCHPIPRDIELGIENLWLFDCHPIPKDVEARLQPKHSSNMCCIGHPHAGPKMVTFGQLLDISTERFDNQYRRKTQPNSECQCKEVRCIQYSCKTCEGSGGSLVSPLYKGMHLKNVFCHFMGRSVTPHTIRGELIENINSAWLPTSYC